jgi:monovalent cation:proton antiporter-2 (CPA2) family protein
MNYTFTGIALLAAAVILVPLFRTFKLGGVLGYIAAGVLIGPQVLGIVKQPEIMAHTAELGVTLLMFLVGLELQPSRLFALRREVFGLGAAQVLGCGAVFGLGTWALGIAPQAAWIVGAGIAMSSTAFILPMLTDAKATQARYGRESIAVCIFQDLAIIPILLVIGLLGTGSGKVPGWGALVAVVLIALLGRRVMGWVFAYAARFGSNEVFTAAALCITLMISAGLAAVGLSASLGAFIGGVLLVDSAFKHKLEASIAPFEGLLLGLFFMTVGMGVNLTVLWTNPWLP